MKNITPRTLWELAAITGRSITALHKWEAVLAITHSTAARTEADLEAAELALSVYCAAKTASHKAVRAKAAAQRRAYKLLMITRDLLRQNLGTRYSRCWDEVGFYNQTLKIPVLAAYQIGKLSSLKEYFAAHPESEVAGVATGAIAAEVYEQLAASVSAVNHARSEQRERKAERDAAVAALRRRVQQLYAELKIVLPLDDSRWLEFGFNIPVDVKRPVDGHDEQESVTPDPTLNEPSGA